MDILVERFTSNKESTLGLLFLDGIFECFTLEDEYRTEKVYGETRIAAGKYPVSLRTHGGFHKRYSNKFPEHKGMLEIQSIPGFTDVLFHIGNDDDDTAGCILVGRDAERTNGGESYKVLNSTVAYKHFYYKVISAMNNGEDANVEIVDR